MRINLYLSTEEYAHIKTKEEGYIRLLVQESMRTAPSQGKVSESIKTPKEVIPKIIKTKKDIKSSKGDGLNTCKTCGYLLPYFKGRCKNGCK
jgi:hypothetical protein